MTQHHLKGRWFNLTASTLKQYSPWKSFNCEGRTMELHCHLHFFLHKLKNANESARLKLCESDMCWRCERSGGTLLHMLYECEMTHNLWEKIILLINKVFRTDLSQSPALCTFGIIADGVELSSQQTQCCRLALTMG